MVLRQEMQYSSVTGRQLRGGTLDPEETRQMTRRSTTVTMRKKGRMVQYVLLPRKLKQLLCLSTMLLFWTRGVVE